MSDLTFLVAAWLMFSVASSKIVHQSCHPVQGGICGLGQFLVLAERACADCPPNTFMDIDSHMCRSCKRHTKPGAAELIAIPGDARSDNTIMCQQGFYKPQNSKHCRICSVCEDGWWSARECNNGSDTICCPHGMTSIQHDSHTECVPQLHLDRKPKRKGRSSLSSSSNLDQADNTGDNFDTSNSDKTTIYVLQAETEKPRKPKVEFPFWGQMLCVAIAIGIFLFYLGVGIPCNACGSKDALHKIVNKLRGNRRPPVDEESKQPINENFEAGKS